MAYRFFMFSVCAAAVLVSGAGCKSEYKMGTYGYDLEYLAGKNVETVELAGNDGKSRVLLSAGYQGRVMTSTADGLNGKSYGWLNYKFMDAGEVSPQFNPIGGEERFWIGPEGGPYSWYFKKGQEQVYDNWVVPSFIDTEAFEVASQSESSVIFTKLASLQNASDHSFQIGVEREVAMLDKAALQSVLGLEVPENVKSVAYKTVNRLTNKGDFAWTKETGMPSVWLLGSFNPTPTTTVFIPYNKDYEGKIVNDEYFGKVPSDRLKVEDGFVYFKIDGEYRSKIGLPSGSAKDLCGSYDYEQKVLNILKYTVPAGKADYVNGQWGEQEDPFAGDVINSYNDGPTADGTVMGPFYEIETSSPGAALNPGESLEHIQYTIHFEGDEAQLSQIAEAVFGVDLQKVSSIFK